MNFQWCTTIYSGLHRGPRPSYRWISHYKVNPRHASWPQHLCKVTDCDGLCYFYTSQAPRLHKNSKGMWAKIKGHETDTIWGWLPVCTEVCFGIPGGHDRVFVYMVAAPLIKTKKKHNWLYILEAQKALAQKSKWLFDISCMSEKYINI